ncbi:MAG: acyltransferase [Prevotellaceae bacterium]|jgi:surface polysaccharide O-acyltransferase-like enzyme|nr:acyltransferase [Prevotellaceae bacterium]
MNQYISDKIKILSTVSIILVLYIHSGFHADEIAGMTLNDNVQKFISGMIGRCAVPLFFVISGWLFFLKVPDGVRSVFAKIKKRVRTLLVPYIIASAFFVLFFLILGLIPGVERFMNGNLDALFAKKWTVMLYEILWRTESGSPVAFQLWFLRDLMILVAISPLLYYALKYLKWSWLLVVFVLNFIVSKEFFPVYALLWFSLGAYLTQLKPKTMSIDVKWGG